MSPNNDVVLSPKHLITNHLEPKLIDEPMQRNDRFIIVGSGCSGAVPLCCHLFKGINREQEEKRARARYEKAKELSSLVVVDESKAKIKHQLSGSEGPCSSESKDSTEGLEVQRMKIPDIDDIDCDLWLSNLHETAPSFELYTRNVLYDFQSRTRCRCKTILSSGADGEKERRNNVSCLLQMSDHTQDEYENYSNILVDVGKTFRDACIKVLVPLGVTRLDEVFITHAHADAMGGLDDLREFQTYSVLPVDNSLRHVCHRALPITCTSATASEIIQKHDYCFNSKNWTIRPNGSIIMKSRWPAYKVDNIEKYPRTTATEPDGRPTPQYTGTKFLNVSNGRNLVARFYPVFHGGEYISMGFGFGQTYKILYLSDVKAVSSDVLSIMCQDGPWDLLVIDCLAPIKYHYSHANMYEALNFARAVNPCKVRFVGMTCIFPPEETETILSEWLGELMKYEKTAGQGICGIHENEYTRMTDINLAYDGEFFEVEL